MDMFIRIPLTVYSLDLYNMLCHVHVFHVFLSPELSNLKRFLYDLLKTVMMVKDQSQILFH